MDVDSWAYLFDEGKLRLYRKKASMLEEAVELAIAAKIYMGLDVNDWSNATMGTMDRNSAVREKRWLFTCRGPSSVWPPRRPS